MRLERVSATYLLGLPALPGICPGETTLIVDFVRRCGRDYRAFSVDVPVGPGDTSAPSLGAAIDRMWAAITRPRIDLVVHGWGATYILEAKVHARMTAATQVLRYVDRYRSAAGDGPPVYPIVLCRSHASGLPAVLRAYGGVVVVEPAAAAAVQAAL